MSEHLAILVIDGQRFALVDYDCPVWLQIDAASGIRILPSKEHIVADGLAGFALGTFDGFAEANRGLVDVNSVEQEVELDDIRHVIYRMETANIELLLKQPLQSDLLDQVQRFVNPIRVTIEDGIDDPRWSTT